MPRFLSLALISGITILFATSAVLASGTNGGGGGGGGGGGATGGGGVGGGWVIKSTPKLQIVQIVDPVGVFHFGIIEYKGKSELREITTKLKAKLGEKYKSALAEYKEAEEAYDKWKRQNPKAKADTYTGKIPKRPARPLFQPVWKKVSNDDKEEIKELEEKLAYYLSKSKERSEKKSLVSTFDIKSFLSEIKK